MRSQILSKYAHIYAHILLIKICKKNLLFLENMQNAYLKNTLKNTKLLLNIVYQVVFR